MTRYWKAINAALLAGLTSAGVALTDGHITTAEWITIAIAVVGTSGGVAITSNGPDPTVLAMKSTLADHDAVLNFHADQIETLTPASPPHGLHPLAEDPPLPVASGKLPKRDARGHFAK